MEPTKSTDLHMDGSSGAAGTMRAGDLVGTEIRNLIADVKDLLKQVTAEGDPALAHLRSRVEHGIASVKDAFVDGQEQMTARAASAIRRTDRLAHDRPWQMVGIAALAGLLVGVVAARR